jgi:hypothetical protein
MYFNRFFRFFFTIHVICTIRSDVHATKDKKEISTVYISSSGIPKMVSFSQQPSYEVCFANTSNSFCFSCLDIPG